MRTTGLGLYGFYCQLLGDRFQTPLQYFFLL